MLVGSVQYINVVYKMIGDCNLDCLEYIWFAS